jgi:hypothetical protein
MADGQFATPIIVGEDGESTVLQRIPVSGDGSDYNEAFIQDLAFKHPGCLPVTEIDRAYDGLIPVCKELGTPAGPLDILYVTSTGRLVIVEAKLWRNPEARRKVVGQVLDYAKELSRWDYEDLQREVSRASGRKGNALYDLVREHDATVDEATFVDEITHSLQKGRFLLMVLGDGIREGVGAIAEFLENAGSLEFTFGLVELALYRADGVGILVQPRVLAKTVIFKRTVVTLVNGQLVTEEDSKEIEQEREPSELEQFYQGFWPELIEELQLDDTSQPMPKSLGKVGNIFFMLPPGRGGSWVTVYFYQQSQEVGVFLTFPRGALADEIYQKLSLQREEIDRELGIDVTWEANDGKYKIVCRKRFPELRDAAYREDIKAFFKDVINSYINVFRPRLEKIDDEI